MAALAWNLSLWMRAFLAFIVGLLNNRINKLLPFVCFYRPALVAGTFSGLTNYSVCGVALSCNTCH
jgi:hypothetical protein